MATSDLIQELADPAWQGMSSKEIAAELSTPVFTFKPCSGLDLQTLFDKLLLPARIRAEFGAGELDKATWVRWLSLTDTIAKPDAVVMFDAAPVLVADLFTALASAKVIDSTELGWLMDLGRDHYVPARGLFGRDLTAADIDAAKQLNAVHDEIVNREIAVEADYQAKLSEVSAARDVLNTTADGEFGKVIAAPTDLPVWKTEIKV